MILGLTGKNGSGKGVAAEFLGQRSFAYHSLSDVIRDELQARGLEVTREHLIATGNGLRAGFGPAVLAERILERLPYDCHAIVDSIRHPAEVRALRTRRDFVLLNIEAEPRVRFERLRQRGRENDPQTFEDFLDLDRREARSDSEFGQQVEHCQDLADHTLANNCDVEALHAALQTLVLEVLMNQPRPSWDEYFMEIARVVASRSNCIKRKVAAIVVKDAKIISTGYNGTPRGARNCNEGGCPRCNSLSQGGANLGECLCSHAEENAITQAAYHGVTLRDAGIYSTFAPCLICSKMIINAGIREVVYSVEYPLNDVALKLLEEAGVKVRQFTFAKMHPPGAAS